MRIFRTAPLALLTLVFSLPAAAYFAHAQPKPAGIALEDGTVVGTARLPSGDAPGGGSGHAVHGIRCEAMEGSGLHVHAHLSIIVDGAQIAVPSHIGVVPLETGPDPEVCYYWLHTHDATGIVHVESPVRRDFTLSDLFAIWGQPLSDDRVARYRGTVTSFVDGRRYDGDPARIPLARHAQITLEIGRVVPPPSYVFPAGDR
jgi:hypothetical protein